MRANLSSILWLLGASVALAQPYQIQQGNVLDVNPQYGSGGINAPGRPYQINAGNRIVTGNVTGGAGFRGFSPISDPSSFGLTNSGGLLPSDQLYNFRRDTYSVADVRSGMNFPYARSAYYSQSSAITNTGAIVSGRNLPGTSQLQSPYLSPRIDLRTAPANPLDQYVGAGSLSIAPRVERVDSGQMVSGPINQRLLGSPLFGAVRAVPVDVLKSEAAQSASLGANLATPIDGRIQPASPLDQRALAQQGQAPGSPDAAAPRILTPPPLEELVGAGARPGSAQTSPLPPGGRLPDTGLSAGPAGAQTPRDTFAAMQQAGSPIQNPLERPRTLAEAGAAQRTASGTLIQPLAPPQAAGPAGVQAPAPGSALPIPSGIEVGPLRSFVGTEQSALNRYLSQAEAAMRSGQYYKAENLYDIARAIAPDNPLPLLGRSLALLAAGEYISSVSSLFRAIEIYEGLAQFPVDLSSFVPDARMLDRRRADLERRLDAGDDYRLRFLLGYAEYTSGLQPLGLQNMNRAASAAPAELESLRRFVTHLALPAPAPSAKPNR